MLILFKSLPVLMAALFLTACGSMMEGASQKVRLDTPGAQEAECQLDNGVRYRVRGGESVEIQKSRQALTVDCYAAGNRHKTITVESVTSDWAAGNVATGVVPGTAYDHFSGGLYHYPDVITVNFVGVPTTGFELPDYHYKDAPSPYRQSIESMGASTAAIPSDSTYLKRGLERRDATQSMNPFAQEKSVAVEAPSVPAMTPTKPNLSGKDAETLTRSANPSVFGGQ